MPSSRKSLGVRILTYSCFLFCFWVVWQRIEFYRIVRSLESVDQYLRLVPLEDVNGFPKLIPEQILGRAITTNFLNGEIGAQTAVLEGFYGLAGNPTPFKILLKRDLSADASWKVERVQVNLFIDLVDGGLSQPQLDISKEQKKIRAAILREIKRFCDKDFDHRQLEVTTRKVWNFNRQVYSSYRVLDEKFPAVSVVSQWTTWGQWLHNVRFKGCYLDVETAQNQDFASGKSLGLKF